MGLSLPEQPADIAAAASRASIATDGRTGSISHPPSFDRGGTPEARHAQSRRLCGAAATSVADGQRWSLLHNTAIIDPHITPPLRLRWRGVGGNRIR